LRLNRQNKSDRIKLSLEDVYEEETGDFDIGEKDQGVEG
jgi:hypothetical protein